MSIITRIRIPLVALAVIAAFALTATAQQQALDRKKVPPPGKTPTFQPPTWTRSTLTNGADLIVSEKHDLPLVSFTITFVGGTNQYEGADRRGLASTTAAMMLEGTKTR